MKPSTEISTLVLVTTLMLSIGTGCNGQLGDEFREAAASNLESGVMNVLTGLVDGAFAVYEPGTTESTDSGEE